ncbi:uncharacterized protein DUF721 [Alkalispirillum mobile]|uniref:Uncharacterized protein DUF721 n=1 Tax=Alkalispirillum mobile TaxID=85925 RepID=A0A498C8F2_9GAMM|nr:DciA family protein [Alkalispirillum mobile]RLK48571.1 uncharacterized protein DUF721 [Alkalispirillum mobile]
MNRPGKPQRLNHWLNQLPVEQRTMRQLSHFARLANRLKGEMPPELQGPWKLAALDAERLLLVTEDSLWATRLRYLEAPLLDAAERISGLRPRQLEVQVRPTKARERRRGPPRKAPGPEAIASIRQSAAHAPEPLRQALLRLADDMEAYGKKG